MNSLNKILITGGNGCLAKGLIRELNSNDKYEIFHPGRSELDVSSIDSVDDYFSDKTFDIVINAAGSLYSSVVIKSVPELWINDINSNLIGTYLISRKALINNRRCKIINIASTAAFNSYKDWTSYCAAKSGVIKLSMGLQKDGYDVIILCPGAIDTSLRDGLTINNPKIMTVAEAIIPILDSINGMYKSGDIIFYRKGQCEVNPDFILESC